MLRVCKENFITNTSLGDEIDRTVIVSIALFRATVHDMKN